MKKMLISILFFIFTTTTNCTATNYEVHQGNVGNIFDNTDEKELVTEPYN